MPNPATAGLPNPAQYDISLAGTVLDEVAQLLWQRDVTGDLEGLRSPAEAEAECDALTLADFDDWRLPSRQELLTLVDFTRDANAIDPVFPAWDGSETAFWTATPMPSATSRWVYVFATGEPGLRGSTQTALVRCVRGAAFAASFQAGSGASAGTVVDSTTGLVWQQEAATGVDANAAESYCAALELGTLVDWRVPSIKELQLTVDEARNEPALDLQLFPGGAAEWPSFWSSSPLSYDATRAWVLDGRFGRTLSPLLTPGSLDVRCVH